MSRESKKHQKFSFKPIRTDAVKKTLILLSIVLCSSFVDKTEYHQDFWVVQNYDNVKTRIETGYDYEEIKKIEFIGQYARDFAKKQNFKKPIFLDFVHHYTSDCDPDYFISIGDGRVRRTYDHNRKPPLSSEGIVIRQVKRRFDIEETLKLLDYAISHQQSIKSNQKMMRYYKNYEKVLLTTIDTSLVNSVLKKNTPESIHKVRKTKIWRTHKKDELYSVPKYYSRNNKYYIQYREDQKINELELDNIYDFQMIDESSAFVFDSKNSFYYIDRNIPKELPTKTVIKDIGFHFRPYNVQKIGHDKIAIYFRPDFGVPQRTLIYDIRTNKLFQDLDKVFQR